MKKNLKDILVITDLDNTLLTAKEGIPTYNIEMIEKFQSNFVFGLQGNLYQEFIDRVAKPIIQQIIGTDDYEIVPQTYHLSFKDFDKKSRVNSIFPEFYYNFLGDIVKKNNQVSFKTKVCISFDERLCNDICPNTGRKIAIIRVAGIELVYFILFNIKEFFKTTSNNFTC